MVGAMSGAILETYISTEILKSYWRQGKTAHCYYYRDTHQKIVDLLIEANGGLSPIEFKKTASPAISASMDFKALEKLDKPIKQEAVICFLESAVPLSRDVIAIPVGYL